MEPAAPAPDAVWSRYGDKRHLVVVLVGVLVFGALTALGYNANFDSGAATVIGGIVTGFFAVVLLLCVFAAAALPFRRHRLPGVAVDAAGIWWCRDGRATLVPWPAMTGVGVSYLRAPSAAVAAGSSLGRRKHLTLDVFLRALPENAALRTWVVTEPPPTPALPADRLRFALPTGGDRHGIQAAVARHAPQLWVGEHEREWTRLARIIDRGQEQ